MTLIKPIKARPEAEVARMTITERRAYRLGRRLEQWLAQLQRQREPASVFDPARTMDDPGAALEAAVCALLDVKWQTFRAMRRGRELSPWAWSTARAVLGERGRLPSWPEARQRRRAHHVAQGRHVTEEVRR